MNPARWTNYDLREEIRTYWSLRAETFDASPGHEIFSQAERSAWHDFLSKHLGAGQGRRALDLASGTGVVSHLLDDLGFNVTGLDWSEAMLAQARAKARARRRRISFRLGDAERTMESDASYDVIATRHLVWTLVDPAACFAEWLRVLKPGGTLLVVDGDFVNQGVVERLCKRVAAWIERGFGARTKTHAPSALAGMHRSIMSKVHFAQGARAPVVADLLRDAGFVPVVIDEDLRAIHREQARAMDFFTGLARRTQHRYAVIATKPPLA